MTTYNWPKALDRVLCALNDQDYPFFEVIIADDGSKDETADLISSWQSRFSHPLIHCWQSDEGFRAAMSRNRAVARATNEYLIFLDGDCIVLPHFISRHVQLAEKGWFVAGNRVLLNKAVTDHILDNNLYPHHWGHLKWLKAYHLPLGPLRKATPLKWQGAKTCNLGMWKDDFLAVNGFDEEFEGWGFEDSDCVIRLQRAKVFHKSGRYATAVLHLWHPSASRQQEEKNKKRLLQTKESSIIQAAKGVEQYLSYEND